VTLFLHIAGRALLAFLGALIAVVALFLVVDFAEHSSVFSGPGWLRAVLELYANRAAVVAYQTAPAAMLLAAAVTASDLRRTREYTAMRALGLGPAAVVAPVLAVAAVIAIASGLLGDAFVVGASHRADLIMATRFHRTGSFHLGFELERKRWFRGESGRRIYHLRQGVGGAAFERVTVLEVTEDFRLSRRIDAARMTPGALAGEWLLEDVAERRFRRDGGVDTSFAPRRSYRFEEDPSAFAVRLGRPGQMRYAVLREQLALRRRLGLPSHEALGLALRRERKGHFTAALVESVAVSVLFWGLQGACWSMGMSGRLPPEVAAWAPDLIFLAAGALAVRRHA
jgi:lipopolysaccharide export system permease protein